MKINQWLKSMLLVILILPLISLPATAEINLQPSAGGYSCLDRIHRENVELCFEEKDDCHTQLASAENIDDKNYWSAVLVSLAGGFVLGTVVAVKLK